MTTFSCTLPMPPSANNLFPQLRTGRRVQSTEYKSWVVVAGMALWTTLKGSDKLAGRLRAVYTLHFANASRKRDIANYEKAVTDLLVKHGIFADDSQLDDIHILRGPIDPTPRVTVYFEEIV